MRIWVAMDIFNDGSQIIFAFRNEPRRTANGKFWIAREPLIDTIGPVREGMIPESVIEKLKACECVQIEITEAQTNKEK